MFYKEKDISQKTILFFTVLVWNQNVLAQQNLSENALRSAIYQLSTMNDGAAQNYTQSESVDAFVTQISPKVQNTAVGVTDSFGPQGGTLENPRIVRHDFQERASFGVSTNPEAPGFQTIEIKYYSKDKAEPDFGIITFNSSGVASIEKNPKKCSGCHFNKKSNVRKSITVSSPYEKFLVGQRQSLLESAFISGKSYQNIQGRWKGFGSVSDQEHMERVLNHEKFHIQENFNQILKHLDEISDPKKGALIKYYLVEFLKDPKLASYQKTASYHNDSRIQRMAALFNIPPETIAARALEIQNITRTKYGQTLDKKIHELDSFEIRQPWILAVIDLALKTIDDPFTRHGIEGWSTTPEKRYGTGFNFGQLHSAFAIRPASVRRIRSQPPKEIKQHFLVSLLIRACLL